MVKITPKRLKELQRVEKILRALEGAGVDNWEGYEIAMEDIEKEDERFRLIEETAESIFEAAAEDADINPAGPGTGVGFGSMAEDSVHEILENFIKSYNKI